MIDDEISNHVKRMNRLDRIQKITITSFFVSLFVIAGTVLGFYFFEKPTLTYQNSPFPVLQMPLTLEFTPLRDPLHAGDRIPLLVKICSSNKKTTSYSMARRIESVDSQTTIMLLPGTVVILEPGCRPIVSLITGVPKGLPPGTYKIVGKSHVDGTVKSFEIDWESQPFQVE